MRINETTVRIIVRGDYGTCYDFYTQKLGLVPVWGDRNSEYTSFTAKEGEPASLAIFTGANMDKFQGYIQPQGNTQPDTLMVVIPSSDLDADYERLKANGVEFLAPPQFIEGWGMRCTYFRDTEGNLFELNDAESI